MSTKSQTVFAVCFGLFLAVVVTVSLLFADKLPHATQPEGITGGYLFSFNVECVDESGNLLKTQKFTGNGTLWSFEPPEVDGYTTTCASITRDDNLQYALTGNNSILDTVAIEKQIDNYYDQMGTLVERSASTSGDTDLYDREIKKLCDKIEALRETLKTEQSKSVMTEDVKASIDRILGYLSKTDERSFLTYDDVTIRRLVECIVVHPEGKISVTLKGGFRGEETI